MKKVPCGFCDKRGNFKEAYLGQDPLVKIYICEDCWKKLPEKLKGLPVKYKGEVVGVVVGAEVC